MKVRCDHWPFWLQKLAIFLSQNLVTLIEGSNEDEVACHEPLVVEKRQDLEKTCEKCQRKMSVKFDFDKMETEGDPEAWVLFNCSMCATPDDTE